MGDGGKNPIPGNDTINLTIKTNKVGAGASEYYEVWAEVTLDATSKVPTMPGNETIDSSGKSEIVYLYDDLLPSNTPTPGKKYVLNKCIINQPYPERFAVSFNSTRAESRPKKVKGSITGPVGGAGTS